MNRGSKRAFGEARMTSQARGRLTPAPITGPFTAATDGMVSRVRARNPAYISRSDARGSRRSSTDPPAQKAGGVAVSTSAPTSGSAAASSIAAASWVVTSNDSALRRAGSSSTTTATLPSRSRRTRGSSVSMGGASYGGPSGGGPE